MTESKGAVLAYPRLCIAYFCQFAIWGSWAVALGPYADKVLNLTSIGWLYNAIPLGALIAPLFIGPIADRYFAAQKVMSVLHFVGGLALLACGWLCMSGMATFPLLMGLMLLSGICYMPTMGLINSVVFKHLPSPSMGPYVFVFGTIGWIIVNLVIAGFCGGAETPYFFFVGGGVSIFLALYALTLPNTPPKGAPAPGEKSSGGLGVLSLFKNFSFCIFVLCVFLASVPACNYFFPAQGLFLTERGYPAPVALSTLNQFSEIFLMLALPFCIAKFGLKKVLLIGMAAWSIRYFCFAEPYFAIVVAGLLLHGFCYSFLYVAAYMYAEKVAPAHLKASAQSMMVFLLLGVGQILGGQGYDTMRGMNPPKFTAMPVAASNVTVPEGTRLPAGVDAGTDSLMVPLPIWSDAANSPFRHLDLADQVQRLLGKVEPRTLTLEALEQAMESLKLAKAKTNDQAEALRMGEIEATIENALTVLTAGDPKTVDLRKLLDGKPLTPDAINAMDREQLVRDNVEISKTSACCDTDTVKAFEPFMTSVRYTKDDLKALGKAIAGKENFELTRADWFAAQAHDWKKIWQLPAIFIAGCFVVFLLLGRNPKDND